MVAVNFIFISWKITEQRVYPLYSVQRAAIPLLSHVWHVSYVSSATWFVRWTLNVLIFSIKQSLHMLLLILHQLFMVQITIPHRLQPYMVVLGIFTYSWLMLRASLSWPCAPRCHYSHHSHKNILQGITASVLLQSLSSAPLTSIPITCCTWKFACLCHRQQYAASV